MSLKRERPRSLRHRLARSIALTSTISVVVLALLLDKSFDHRLQQRFDAGLHARARAVAALDAVGQHVSQQVEVLPLGVIRGGFVAFGEGDVRIHEGRLRIQPCLIRAARARPLIRHPQLRRRFSRRSHRS